MGITVDGVSLLRRLAYAFTGLLAGNLLLLLYLIQNALRIRSTLLTAHMGEPALAIPNAIQHFCLLAVLSFVGWLFVGVPIAVLFPARLITGLSWPVALVVGAALGPLAVLAVFLLLGHGYIYRSSSFTGTATPFVYSIVISIVAFVVYRALLNKESRAQKKSAL
jgi:hypothetical protein